MLADLRTKGLKGGSLEADGRGTHAVSGACRLARTGAVSTPLDTAAGSSCASAPSSSDATLSKVSKITACSMSRRCKHAAQPAAPRQLQLQGMKASALGRIPSTLAAVWGAGGGAPGALDGGNTAGVGAKEGVGIGGTKEWPTTGVMVGGVGVMASASSKALGTSGAGVRAGVRAGELGAKAAGFTGAGCVRAGCANVGVRAGGAEVCAANSRALGRDPPSSTSTSLPS